MALSRARIERIAANAAGLPPSEVRNDLLLLAAEALRLTEPADPNDHAAYLLFRERGHDTAWHDAPPELRTALREEAARNHPPLPNGLFSTMMTAAESDAIARRIKLGEATNDDAAALQREVQRLQKAISG